MAELLARLKSFNIWRILTFAISLYAIYVIGGTALSMIRTSREIKRLNAEKRAYQHAISQDEKQLERLQDPCYIEQYARERYGMQRPNEDVYIIE